MTAAQLPKVSAVIPCRNEARYIGACLDSLLTCDYPQDRLEILVADGMSDDGTREIVREYATRHPAVRLLDNPRRITPAAMNVGVRQSTGAIIMPMGAHALYPPDYITRLVAALDETGADNVGGVLVTVPADDTPVARALAIALSHPLGVGNSYFRIGATERRVVDTVPFGCYRRAVFDRIGLFDEDLVRNQDDELNGRLVRQGGRIVLIPDVVSRYFARSSFRQVWRMFFQYGYFKPLAARKIGRVLTVRQLVPALFVVALAASAVLAPWLVAGRWLLAAIATTYLAAISAAALGGLRYGARCALALAAAFPVLHVSYGVGFLAGLWPQRADARRVAVVPLSR
ncbi:MAG TPA: glycosyltransferase family 2 protein [Gemmatimonadales bacterium]|nr:glycosyltransferase family 2 protein [Gemmatimonadales bacterium]